MILKNFIHITLYILFFPYILFSQHCPFDGTMILVVKTPKKLKANECIMIEETSDYQLGICSYGDSKLKDTLRTKQERLFLSDRQAKYFDEYLKKSSKDFIKDAYMLVRSYHSIECVERKKDEKDYEYTQIHPRSFTLRLVKKGKVLKKKRITSKDFYSLCTSAGSWDRIVALEF